MKRIPGKVMNSLSVLLLVSFVASGFALSCQTCDSFLSCSNPVVEYCPTGTQCYTVRESGQVKYKGCTQGCLSLPFGSGADTECSTCSYDNCNADAAANGGQHTVTRGSEFEQWRVHKKRNIGQGAAVHQSAGIGSGVAGHHGIGSGVSGRKDTIIVGGGVGGGVHHGIGSGATERVGRGIGDGVSGHSQHGIGSGVSGDNNRGIGSGVSGSSGHSGIGSGVSGRNDYGIGNGVSGHNNHGIGSGVSGGGQPGIGRGVEGGHRKNLIGDGVEGRHRHHHGDRNRRNSGSRHVGIGGGVRPTDAASSTTIALTLTAVVARIFA